MVPDPRTAAPALASIALIPVAIFLFDRGEYVVVLSVVSVVLIAASLYYMLSPTDSDSDSDSSHGGLDEGSEEAF